MGVDEEASNECNGSGVGGDNSSWLHRVHLVGDQVRALCHRACITASLVPGVEEWAE